MPSEPSQSQPTAGKSAFYLPELDVLRAFAFFAVFAKHFTPNDLETYERHGFSHRSAHVLASMARTGENGVMLFFCLSSYLITHLLLRELSRRGRVRVGAFYMRRVLRIWPLYLVFTAIAASLPLVDPEQNFGWKAVLPFLLFGGNWVFALGIPVKTVATPLWSISVEEQFYICWPWVVRRATPASLKRTVVVLLLVAAANRVLVVTHVIHTNLWNNTFTQLDSIALGALLALGAGERGASVKRRFRAHFVVLAVLVCVAARYFKGDDDQPWSLVYYPLVAVCCAVVLWSVIGAEIDRSSVAMRVLLYLGKISYGLYVIHSFAIYLVEKLLARLPIHAGFLGIFVVRGMCALLLTISLAAISYRWLESPFLRFKRSYS
jgi:peptidoglycan/LPS O-acetylase OafA/YrhL